jgi:hypothetical protein
MFNRAARQVRGPNGVWRKEGTPPEFIIEID